MSAVKVQDEMTGLPELTHGPDAAAVHDFSIIMRDVTRQIGQVSGILFDEIGVRFSEGLGLDEEQWVEVKPAETVEKAVSRIINRIAVGKPLSDDRRYLDRVHGWELAFGISGLILRYTPNFLWPLLTGVLTLWTGIAKWRVHQLLLPEIRQRIIQLQPQTPLPSKEGVKQTGKKNDLLQWTVSAASKKSDPREMDPWNITGRTILYFMFAEHTSWTTAVTILFDILSFAKAPQLVAELREEAENVLPRLAEDPYCTREMTKMDSVIRETMRFEPMFGHALLRQVVKPGGITTPDGLVLAEGCHVLVNVIGMQRDKDIYANGDEYRPLRFCTETGTQEKQKSASQVSEQFLGSLLASEQAPLRIHNSNNPSLRTLC